MSSGPSVRLLPLAVLTVLAAGCAKPPPILSLEGRICVDRPDLARASAVPLAEDKPVSVTLDEKTPCIESAGSGKAAYAAFSLPQTAEEYVLSVTSIPIGEGRFSPKLALLDIDGNKLRDVPADMFMAHGVSLHAGLRPHLGERYLIVSSDPDTIGQTSSQIMDGTRASTTLTAGVIVSIHTGHEDNVTLTNAYNGTVTVAAQPIPKVK